MDITPCVTTCLPVFVAWRLCPVCGRVPNRRTLMAIIIIKVKIPPSRIQPDAALSRTDRRSRSKVQRLPRQVDEMGDDRTDAYPVGRALPSGAPPSPCSVLSSPTEQNHATPWDHPRPATRGPSASGVERAPCCIALLKAATPCLGPRSSSRGTSEASPAVDAKRPSATAAKRPSSARVPTGNAAASAPDPDVQLLIPAQL